MRGRVGGDARAGLGHAVALLEAGVGELALEFVDDFFRERGSARGEAGEEGEVVVRDEWVADEADEDGGHEEELGDAVGYDRVEHGGHGEGGEHDHFCVEEEGEVQGVD